jgi:hypothetical protein
MQIGARQWAKQDRVRQKLALCYDGMQREERIRVMRDQWRAEVARRVNQNGEGRRGEVVGEVDDV